MNKDGLDRSEKIEAVEFELFNFNDGDGNIANFRTKIAQAASDAQAIDASATLKERLHDARLAAEQGFNKAAKEIEEQFGVSIGFGKPWAYKPKPKSAYTLWKRVVPMFIQQPDTLSLKPRDLVALLDGSDMNLDITRDMMYDPLNSLALRELDRLLKSFGVSIVVKQPATIRSLQKQLLARIREKEGAAESFTGKFKVCGDTAYVNGFPYQIQRNASGKPRIKIGGRHWLALDTVRAFCTRLV